MSDEKKIEDLIYSISSLIKEAHQENKLLLEIENKIEKFDFKKENNFINKGISYSGKEKPHGSESTKNSKYYDWRSLSFIREKQDERVKVSFEKNFYKIFESEIKIWMKLNLKDLIQDELNKFSGKIISEKLK